jgi:hypothetical protein
MPYKRVHIKDVSGAVHTVNWSTDPRGLAQDGGSPGFNRGFRPSRDRSVGHLPVSTRGMSRDQGALSALGALAGGAALSGGGGGGGGGGQGRGLIGPENDYTYKGGGGDQDRDQQVTPEDIANIVLACIDRFEGSDREELLQRLGDIVRVGQNGNDAAAFSVPKPHVSASDQPSSFRGRPRVGGAQDAALAMDKAQLSLPRRDPVLAGYISRIKTYGY